MKRKGRRSRQTSPDKPGRPDKPSSGRTPPDKPGRPNRAQPGKRPPDKPKRPDGRQVGRTPPPDRPGPKGLGGGGVPIDPYLRWAIATNYAYLPGDPAGGLPILIKLKEGLTAQRFATKEWGDVVPPADMDSWFRIHDIYKEPPAGLGPLQYSTAVVDPDSMHRLLDPDPENPFAKVIEGIELSDPVGNTNVPLQVAQQAATGWNPSVIVGVIDDGLPFANVRFRDTNISTRIEYLWDQDRGIVLSKAAIDGFLVASAPTGNVDEDEVYRRAGYDYAVTGHKSWARRATHGAHVMHVACGDLVTPPYPRIIGVHLPNAVTADTSGVRLFVHAIVGILNILGWADTVAAANGSGPVPVVVNLSYGINHGPHDGTSWFEMLVDMITAMRRTVKPFTVVLAAGNSHLARCHACFNLAPGPANARPLDWRVLPDDATPGFVELWLPAGAAAAQVKVEVRTPGNVLLGPIPWGTLSSPLPSAAVPWLTASYPALPPVGSGRISVLLILLPTATLDPTKIVAPSGTWRITVENMGAAPLLIDAWIGRDDTPFGYPIRGRQSRFEDAQYVRFDPQGRLLEVDGGPSYVRREGSINGLATGYLTAVIGGCRRSDRISPRYSAGGPTLQQALIGMAPRTGPDATAATEWSPAHPGWLATGTRSHSVIAMNGTSVAAPHVTRWISGRMALGFNGDRTEVAAEGALHPTPNISVLRGNQGFVPEYSPIGR